jgi:gamma-glutamylcyclotransferase (GGCT)/AIG2-like uncharacterized protein YtfP
MFHIVRLQPGDSPKALSALGLKLKRRNAHHEFHQPCVAHCGSACRIYTARPARCRIFECRQVRGVDSGELSEADARLTIQKTLVQAAHVTRLLQEAGRSDPRRPLSKRYEKIMVDLLSDPATDHSGARAELTAAMETLDQMLDQDFRVPREEEGAAGKEPLRIAVYGTLMQGGGGQALAGIGAGMTYVGPCQLRGELYDLGEYPGLLEGDGIVKGEVFTLRDPSVLQRLDRYEGCVDGNPGASLFIRRLVQVPGQRGDCWVYYYNGSAARESRIRGGDWAEHVRQRAMRR